MDRLFILFQHLVPQHLLSRCAGALAELRHPVWLKNWLIGQFIRAFGVDMNEAAEPDYTRYACFNDFFTRPLREGARPLAAADVLCPADGAISQLGAIMFLYGSGTAESVRAATFHLFNHATFKGALFLLVGIIEHQAGTRERRELTGLRSRLPVPGPLATIAA